MEAKIQKITSIQYATFEFIIEVGDTVYTSGQITEIVLGKLDKILNREDSQFTFLGESTYSENSPLWSFYDEYPGLGVFDPHFIGSASHSDWLSVPWEPPEHEELYYQYDTADTVPQLIENEDCGVGYNVTWQFHYEFNPPFYWWFMFYRVLHQYKNYILQVPSIIPSLAVLSTFGALACLDNASSRIINRK